MKKFTGLFALLLSGLLIAGASCTKDAIDLESTDPKFPGEKEPNAVLRILQVNGDFLEDEVVPSDTADNKNWYLTANEDTSYTYEGTPVTLKYTLRGNPVGYVLSQFILQMPQANGYWQIRPLSAGGFNLNVPSLVRSGDLKLLVSVKLFKIEGGEKVDSFITEPVLQVLRLLSVEGCGLSLAGKNRQSLVYRKLNLGEKPGKLKIRFFSMDSSAGNKTTDRFDLKYNGAYVLSSSTTKVPNQYAPSCTGITAGGQRISGWKEYSWTYDPGNGTNAELFVQGNCTDTTRGISWRLVMECPQ